MEPARGEGGDVVTAQKLTPAQRRILEGAARHMFGRLVGGDARMREKLVSLDFIEQDGFGTHGLLYKITQTGRFAITKGNK